MNKRRDDNRSDQQEDGQANVVPAELRKIAAKRSPDSPSKEELSEGSRRQEVEISYEFRIPPLEDSGKGATRGRPPDAPHLVRFNTYLKYRLQNTNHDDACRLTGCEEHDSLQTSEDRKYLGRYLALRATLKKYEKALKKQFPTRSTWASFKHAIDDRHLLQGYLRHSLAEATQLRIDEIPGFIEEIERYANTVETSLKSLRRGISTPAIKADGSSQLVNTMDGWLTQCLEQLGDPPPPNEDGSIDKEAFENWMADVWDSLPAELRNPRLFIWKTCLAQSLPEPCTCSEAREPHGHCVECGAVVPSLRANHHAKYPGVPWYACGRHVWKVHDEITRTGRVPSPYRIKCDRRCDR